MTGFPIAEFRMPNAAKRTGRRRSGFTLIEVLAALAVVLIALPAAMEAISLVTRTATRARRQLEAGNLAAAKLAELVATNQWQSGNLSGDFSDYSANFPDYTWTSTVTQYAEVTTGTTGEVTAPPASTLGGSGVPAASTKSTKAGTLGSSTTSLGAALGGSSSLPVTLEQLDVTVSWPSPSGSQTF